MNNIYLEPTLEIIKFKLCDVLANSIPTVPEYGDDDIDDGDFPPQIPEFDGDEL